MTKQNRNKISRKELLHIIKGCKSKYIDTVLHQLDRHTRQKLFGLIDKLTLKPQPVRIKMETDQRRRYR